MTKQGKLSLKRTSCNVLWFRVMLLECDNPMDFGNKFSSPLGSRYWQLQKLKLMCPGPMLELKNFRFKKLTNFIWQEIDVGLAYLLRRSFHKLPITNRCLASGARVCWRKSLIRWQFLCRCVGNVGSSSPISLDQAT